MRVLVAVLCVVLGACRAAPAARDVQVADGQTPPPLCQVVVLWSAQASPQERQALETELGLQSDPDAGRGALRAYRVRASAGSEIVQRLQAQALVERAELHNLKHTQKD